MSLPRPLPLLGALVVATVASGALAAPPAPLGQSPSPAPRAVVQALDESLAVAPLDPYTPPACTGQFTDVACPGAFAVDWIEQFYADAITAGCGTNPLRYCPASGVTRAEMAVFVEKAMRGTSAWSPGGRGMGNTSLGGYALRNNVYPVNNTAVGYHALTTQSFANGDVYFITNNTAVGAETLYSNQPNGSGGGASNTAVGTWSLYNNSSGSANTAVGGSSLTFVQTGLDNTAIGVRAGGRHNDVITGYGGSNVTFAETVAGSYNTFVGIAGSTADVSNCTAVGMDAYCDATNQVRLGNYYVTSIGGKVGFSALSDARAKTDVRDLDLGLDFVLALRPVSYRLKGGNGRTDMGLVAQDVEALLGDSYNVVDVGGDKDRTLSLRYTDFVAPLVKAIQQQQATIRAQRDANATLEAKVADQQAQIDALLARIESLEAAAQH